VIANHELGRMWQERSITCFKALSLHLPGGPEENHKISHLEQPIFELRFESGAFQYVRVHLSIVTTKSATGTNFKFNFNVLRPTQKRKTFSRGWPM
jgi:hypothetical protein